MSEWLLSRRDRLIVARHKYVFSVGHTARWARPGGVRKLSPGFTLSGGWGTDETNSGTITIGSLDFRAPIESARTGQTVAVQQYLKTTQQQLS
jgi:hypothetical protein